MAQFNSDKIRHYVVTPEFAVKTVPGPDGLPVQVPAFGTIGFRSYTDITGVFGNPGAEVQYVIAKDKYNQPKGKYFTWTQAHNAIVVRDGDHDVEGKPMNKFISAHPWCEGSPNGKYIKDNNGDKIQLDVKFRLLNTEADAEVALEASIRRSKAVISANEIDLETLKEVAILGIGVANVPEKILRHKVTEWATKRPQDYFDVLESGDRVVRASVRKALADGTFQKKGELIMWGNTVIGADENDAVSKILKDEALKSHLVEKTGLVEEKVEKKSKAKGK